MNSIFVSPYIQVEVRRMAVENEELKKTMTLDKERLHALEAALDELHKKGNTANSLLKTTLDGRPLHLFWRPHNIS